jgi:hypothetical protein
VLTTIGSILLLLATIMFHAAAKGLRGREGPPGGVVGPPGRHGTVFGAAEPVGFKKFGLKAKAPSLTKTKGNMCAEI